MAARQDVQGRGGPQDAPGCTLRGRPRAKLGARMALARMFAALREATSAVD
jgi:hypothetical protein